VEAHETDTIAAFKEWGFKTIPVPFRNFMPFGKDDMDCLYVFFILLHFIHY
jgi:hypothetical protein